MKLKLKRKQNKTLCKQRGFNTQKLKRPEERDKFNLELRNRFAILEEQEEKGVEETWNSIKMTTLKQQRKFQEKRIQRKRLDFIRNKSNNRGKKEIKAKS